MGDCLFFSRGNAELGLGCFGVLCGGAGLSDGLSWWLGCLTVIEMISYGRLTVTRPGNGWLSIFVRGNSLITIS